MPASIFDTAKLRTTNGVLQIQQHNPVDASLGAVTVYLPERAYGERLSVEKWDVSANPVNIMGTLRHGDTVEPLVLGGQVMELMCNLNGYWWPVSASFSLPSLGFPALSTYTYNLDGSVSTSTEAGVLTTYSYNGDGTIQSDSRNGVTRTYAYDGSGNLIGIS